ncbi:hypothetical protein L3X38_041988 [Prunus dulcis]|uniref:Uncharacterized protein n=1 Tax=Prunus dulcis TaxID=3755 RepID=A0AAD4UVF1_PRUDU|nr:hypothetical protein L3X38_041988 [Prunus dulcis]
MISCISCSVAKVVAIECVPHSSNPSIGICFSNPDNQEIYATNLCSLVSSCQVFMPCLGKLVCRLHCCWSCVAFIISSIIFNKGYIMAISGFLVTFHTINDSLSLLYA